MTTNHSLSRAEFTALAAGDPDAAIIGKLLAGLLSKRVVMLTAILQRAAERCPEAYPAIDAAYGLLARAQSADRAAVQAVLTHPSVGAWAAGCLRRLQQEGDSAIPPAPETLQVATVAAAAAIRARYAFTADVPLHDGAVMLPTLGLATFTDASAPAATVSATVSSGRVRASITAGGQSIIIPPNPESDAEGWRGLRRLHSHAGAASIVLDLDDIDPDRYGGGNAPSPRCDDASLGAWQSMLDGAWKILAEQYPRRAGALAAGLRAIVPLRREENSTGSSVTRGDAFGGISMTPPGDPRRFADSLIHEFHHSVLYAIAALVPLHHAGPRAEHYSPWRGDPRPFDGVLHGAYAFLGVADFWRGQRGTLTGAGLRAADFEFARWRSEVARASEVLLGSGKLTVPGTVFVQGMAATASGWLDLPVDEEASRLAGRAADDHRVRWRLRNRCPDPAAIAAMTDAWLAGQPCPADPRAVQASVLPQPRRLALSGRALLCNLRLQSPEAIGWSRASAGDIAYMRDEFARALDLYQMAIAADPEDVEAWAGIALTLTESDAAAGLAAAPEVARAVYLDAANRSSAPGIAALDRWLAQPATLAAQVKVTVGGP